MSRFHLPRVVCHQAYNVYQEKQLVRAAVSSTMRRACAMLALVMAITYFSFVTPSVPWEEYKATLLIRNHLPLGPYIRHMPRALCVFGGEGIFL